MLADVGQLIADFSRVATLAGVPIDERDIRHELLRAPHQTAKLPKGNHAIYVFSLTNDGTVVLKVGKAGPQSAARFESQHYLPRSCNSNLGKSIIAGKACWDKLGISVVEETTIGNWLRTNTDRDHFFLNASPLVVNLFETFFQCRLQPLFEG
ncbi:MAG: hypothetical protein LAO76_23080 [Acidobacteriia bacterium]|nr:hypothetical protein [Terriglobia bacterium]